MKIICVARNYPEHARELNNPIPSEPVFFMKPDSALLLGNKAFYIPDFSNEIHHECELVVKIIRLGKNIESQFAHRYYDEVTVGIDFTARDVQNKLKDSGKPWEISKGFDGSAVLGKFIALKKLAEPKDISFRLDVNGSERQKGNTKDMLFGIDEIISAASRYFTLKMGDIIYTGTPAGVASVNINDRLEGYIEDQKLFDFMVK